jgi:hypothetical protein
MDRGDARNRGILVSGDSVIPRAQEEFVAVINDGVVDLPHVHLERGTSIQLGINNFVQSFGSGRSSAVPFTQPNAITLIAQPLLRGAGRKLRCNWIELSGACLEELLLRDKGNAAKEAAGA